MAEYASDRAGKPINVGDSATAIGTVVSISGTGPTATVNVKWYGSGNVSTTLQAQDVAATAQTL